MRVKALITLVVGKQQEVKPGEICDVSDNEAKRLISLNFAEKLKKDPVVNTQSGNKNTTEGQPNGHKSDENSGGQPISPSGATGEVSK